ncbi:hypothetical protein ABBQ38_013403 [Trebouxia sp. C0009 RCD-2024]
MNMEQTLLKYASLLAQASNVDVKLRRDLFASQAQLEAVSHMLQSAQSDVAAEKVKATILQQELDSANMVTEIIQTQASATSSSMHRVYWLHALILVMQLADGGVVDCEVSSKVQAVHDSLSQNTKREGEGNQELLPNHV